MAKKNPKKEKFVRRIQLNAATSIFFGELMQEGLATFEKDEKLTPGHAFAELSKDDKGQPTIIVKSVDSYSICIFTAPHHDD